MSHDAEFLQSFTDDSFIVLCSCGWNSDQPDAAAAFAALDAHRAADLPVQPERCGATPEDALSGEGAECVLDLDHDGPCIPESAADLPVQGEPK